MRRLTKFLEQYYLQIVGGLFVVLVILAFLRNTPPPECKPGYVYVPSARACVAGYKP